MKGVILFLGFGLFMVSLNGCYTIVSNSNNVNGDVNQTTIINYTPPPPVISPIIVIIVMYPLFQFLSMVFHNNWRIGWILGLMIYWLFWCIGYPLLIIGRKSIGEIIKPQKPNVSVGDTIYVQAGYMISHMSIINDILSESGPDGFQVSVVYINKISQAMTARVKFTETGWQFIEDQIHENASDGLSKFVKRLRDNHNK